MSGGLVDGAFAAQFRLLRRDGYTVRGGAAIAAAFAYKLINERSFRRIWEGASFSPAAFLRGAGLIVNNY